MRQFVLVLVVLASCLCCFSLARPLIWYKPLSDNWNVNNWIVQGDNSSIFCCPLPTDTVVLTGNTTSSFVVTVTEPTIVVKNISIGRNENVNEIASLNLQLTGGAVTGGQFTATDTLVIQARGSLTGQGIVTCPTVVNNGYIVDPDTGSTKLTIRGNYIQNASASITAVLSSATVFTQVIVESPGAAFLDGSLSIVFTKEFEPEDGLELQLVKFPSSTGNFKTVNVFDEQLQNPRLCVLTTKLDETKGYLVSFSGCSAAPKKESALSGTGLIVVIVLAAVAGVAIIVVSVLIGLKAKRGYIC